jgi:eukaryotic-like serine/threonine-protein kinase
LALTPGTRLGAYEVTAQIGEGGMGQVYRATDTKLKRQVAIKILPPSLAADPDRLARFQREAEVLASLNHPNIAGIYGLEESGGMTALVMELVEGEDLSQRLARGAIPVDEALPIAGQIADALETAHEQGIIHRDLKPANIKVRPDGTVKVLDFGLAKALEPAGNARADPTNSPTITTPAMTQVGMILGTAAYMSPEQAKGRSADKRSDVWAFGCVLFEMLTGQRAFAGDDVSETLAAILMREPDWTAWPSGIPQHIATVAKRCLQKDRKARIPDISAARFLMAEASGFLAAPPADVATLRRRGGQRKAASVVAAATMLALAGVAFIHFREKAPASPVLMRLEVLPPDKTMLQKFAVSPDGRKIAFYAVGADGAGGVWVRSFDSAESRRLAETRPSPSITWSPDSRFVAFPGGDALNKLMKVDVSGGPPQTICDIKSIITGGSWNRDGVIIFGSFGGGTWRVSAAGGPASPVTALDVSRQETGHSTPVFLPDGRHFLYLRQSGLPENIGIYLGALDATPEQQALTRLVATGFSPVYAPSPDPNVGYVLFLRESALQAQPFDVARLQMAGEPVRIAEHVKSIFEFGFFGVSDNGILAYQTGDAIGANALQLTWFDRRGTNLGAAVAQGYYLSLRLSPDASRVAVTRMDLSSVSSNIWLDELTRNTLTRFTSAKVGDADPVWSPDGAHVAYASVRSGRTGLYQKAANGAGGEQLLLEPSGSRNLDDWSRDGHFLLYSQVDSKTRADLWVMPLAGDRQPTVYVNSEFNETHGQFSPDGHWIAYASDESGRPEIYVRPFPLTADSGKWTVSNGGGVMPRWRRDGKELFFLTTNFHTVMVAEVSNTPSFTASVPVPAFSASIQNNAATGGGGSDSFNWDVTADGKKFLLATVATQEHLPQPAISVVLNWTALLKQ